MSYYCIEILHNAESYAISCNFREGFHQNGSYQPCDGTDESSTGRSHTNQKCRYGGLLTIHPVCGKIELRISLSAWLLPSLGSSMWTSKIWTTSWPACAKITKSRWVGLAPNTKALHWTGIIIIGASTKQFMATSKRLCIVSNTCYQNNPSTLPMHVSLFSMILGEIIQGPQRILVGNLSRGLEASGGDQFQSAAWYSGSMSIHRC